MYFLKNLRVEKFSCSKGHLVYSFGIIFMITLLSGPFKSIKFSLFKVVDPPNFLLKFNMAEVKLSLRERLPTSSLLCRALYINDPLTSTCE